MKLSIELEDGTTIDTEGDLMLSVADVDEDRVCSITILDRC